MKKESNKVLAKQAVLGSFWHEIATILQKAGGLIFTIIIARILLPEGYGLYTLAMSVILIFYIFAKAGIDNAFIRYVSSSRNKKEETKYFKFIFVLKIGALLISSLVLLVLALPVSSYILQKPQIFIPLLLAALFTFITSLEEFFNSFFFVVKRIEYQAQKEIIYQTSRILFLVIALFFLLTEVNVNHVFVILILASVPSLLFLVYKTYIISPHLFKKEEGLAKDLKKRVLKFSGYLTLASVTTVFLGSIDSIMLGLLISDTSFIGFYKSAFVLMASVSGLITFGSILMPYFVRINGKDLEKAFNMALRYHMILVIPATAGLIFLSNYFISIIFGIEYLNAIYPLFVLSLLMISTIRVILFREVFLAKEKTKDVFYLVFPVLLINVILNFILIKVFASYSLTLATLGAAVATVVSWEIYAIGLEIMARKKFGLKAQNRTMLKPLVASLLMVLILYLGRLVLSEINVINWIVLVILGGVVYFATMLLIGGISKRDYFVLEIFRNKLKKMVLKS